MARDPQYGVTTDGWQHLVTTIEVNAQDLPHLLAKKDELVEMLQEVRSVTVEQTAFAASRQEATRRLQARLTEGRKLATFLRAGVRQHYGNRSEKLAEFRLQPFRGRRPAPPVEPEPEPESTPTE
jgi:hypothetical protein